MNSICGISSVSRHPAASLCSTIAPGDSSLLSCTHPAPPLVPKADKSCAYLIIQVSQLDQLCSGNLDAFLEEANRIASRESSFSQKAVKTNAAHGKHAKANAAKKQVGDNTAQLLQVLI